MSADNATTAALTTPPIRDGFDAVRGPARERFLAHGWPTRRNEAYKYTDLSALSRQDWPRAPRSEAAPALPDALGTRSLWVDGYAENEMPDTHFVKSLSECASSPPDRLKALLGKLAPADDPIVSVNTALFDHGAWISLPEAAAPNVPLELAYASADRSTIGYTHARLALELGRGSRLVLVERHLGEAETLATRVAEISLAAGARLLHIRLNEAGSGRRLLGHTTVHAGENASYQCLNLDFGARLSRETFQIELAAEGATAELHGLALLDGKRHSDADVKVIHHSGNTKSLQRFRGVLDGRSRSVYTGRVVVAEQAQKSDSAQESANLLLSPHAEVDTRPQLEIYADDVTCSHGAATGALDPEALFYMQSRGLDATTAKRMIAYGFAANILSGIEDESLRGELSTLLAGHMKAPREVLEWL